MSASCIANVISIGGPYLLDSEGLPSGPFSFGSLEVRKETSLLEVFKVFVLLMVLQFFNYVMSVQLLFTAVRGMSAHFLNYKSGCRLSCALMGKDVK